MFIYIMVETNRGKDIPDSNFTFHYHQSELGWRLISKDLTVTTMTAG